MCIISADSVSSQRRGGPAEYNERDEVLVRKVDSCQRSARNGESGEGLNMCKTDRIRKSGKRRQEERETR